MPFFATLGLWFALTNALAFHAFRSDKESAVAGGWRIPEATLLTLAFLGGWPAAKLAQRRFRHKTRKEPFRSLLNLCVLGPPLVGFVAFTAWTDPQVARLPEGLAGTIDALTGGDGPAAGRTVTIRRGDQTETVTLGD